jgi:hypothetical protein
MRDIRASISLAVAPLLDQNSNGLFTVETYIPKYIRNATD